MSKHFYKLLQIELFSYWEVVLNSLSSSTFHYKYKYEIPIQFIQFNKKLSIKRATIECIYKKKP